MVSERNLPHWYANMNVLVSLCPGKRLGFRPTSTRLRKTTVFAVLHLMILWAAHGNDWPQFRGPKRDGVWDETGIVETFPRGGLKIAWPHPVGGGFSSPVVTEGRVFLSDVLMTKPKSRERVHCFDEKTGKMLWVFGYEEHYGEWAFVPERGAGPTATPIVEKGRIYV